jgi:ubiquinone/menaquinone biosynthesis C-methylase UbiE
MSEVASHRAEMPEGTTVILDKRTLQADNQRLAELLTPGTTVLDVGCGTGAITRGIAETVAPDGQVVGLDSNLILIKKAQQAHRQIENLSFEAGDIYKLPYEARFDIVTAARVLQWLDRPEEALQQMIKGTKPGSKVLVLDYNHEKFLVEPAAPKSWQRFFKTYLQWRAEAGMDNAIADHLAEMFERAGLVNIRVTQQHEETRRGKADFATRIAIKAEVVAQRGPQLVAENWISESERATAEADYREWIKNEAEYQRLYLLSVEGIRPK